MKRRCPTHPLLPRPVRNLYPPAPLGHDVVDTVRPEQLAELLRAHPGQAVLLDVREPDEREVARIEPSLHIPMNEVPARLAEIPKDKQVIVYCHHGGRSLMVASYLSGQGFQKLGNLDGGIDAWSLKVDPSIPRYS
jgi:rhodanese-related sulfurtransferase